ncbi:MAG: thioredoxin family protein [Deltaproteobacteria bacterium]|nr:thioredoxin family protein [Deltaproteobacteria bacterium]
MNFLYILLVVIGLFVSLVVFMRVFVYYKSSAMKGKEVPEIGGKAGKFVSRGGNALFYFYSPGCGACKAMTPVVIELSKNTEGVFPVDISKEMATAKKLGVMATPTIVVIKNKIVDKIVMGPQPAHRIKELLS